MARPTTYVVAFLLLCMSANAGYKSYNAFRNGIITYKTKSWHSLDASSAGKGYAVFCVVFLGLAYWVMVRDE